MITVLIVDSNIREISSLRLMKGIFEASENFKFASVQSLF